MAVVLLWYLHMSTRNFRNQERKYSDIDMCSKKKKKVLHVPYLIFNPNTMPII